MQQTSAANDKKMHELSQKIGFAKDLEERAGKIHDEAWEAVRAIFGEFPQIGKRFIANDGYYLHDQRKQGSPKLNDQELYEAMHKHWEDDPETFRRMWNSITVIPPRVVDPAKLEKAVNKGNIPTELYKSCIHTPDATYARIHHTWTKEDVNRAFIFDVQMEDPDVLKEKRIAMLEGIIAELRGVATTG